uniref:CD300e molecule n=1 Tax=Canis lupus dingo TaxID=286419 RepID=A0A8C0LAU7_CANLU
MRLYGVLRCGLCFPGSLSLTGPDSVMGTLGGSLSVQCQYEKKYQEYNKYWCRGNYDITCENIVETKGKEKEERSGRVTIRDHAVNLTFIVTMENLTADDAGSYWCKIQKIWLLDMWSYDPSVQVKVSVFEGKRSFYSISGSFPVPISPHRSLLNSIHFLLLVFLKLPLFLTLVGAVLWVNRPQKGCGGSQPDEKTPQHSAPLPGMPCPGI